MIHYQRIDEWRQAADVDRFHVVRMLTRQTVGQHTFNMLLLAMHVTDWKASQPLIHRIITHDLPELHTGDVPANVKRGSPALREYMETMEDYVSRDMRLVQIEFISEADKALFEWLDRMELWLTALDEMRSGNRHVVPMLRRVVEYLDDMDLMALPASPWATCREIMNETREETARILRTWHEDTSFLYLASDAAAKKEMDTNAGE